MIDDRTFKTEDNEVILLDGALGTLLIENGLKKGERPESFNLTHPETMEKIHRDYVEAGSSIIYANTFGANPHKLKGTGLDYEEVITAGIENAKKASMGKAKVALDIGPIGELMEPDGTLSFDEAYEIFRKMVICGKNAGADLVVFETMTDLNEVRAAILSVKENTDLPVFVTMTFEKNGRTFQGTSIEALVTVAEGMGADAVGINCSLGPKQMKPLIEKMRNLTDLPLIVKANAGLPDPESGKYDTDSEEYAKNSEDNILCGVKYIGGCCGTDPEYIRNLEKLILRLKGRKRIEKNNEKKHIIACSQTETVYAGDVIPVGERINPTGKKELIEELKNGSFDMVLKEAVSQKDTGARILDINMSFPGSDEKNLLEKAVISIQGVCDLPLQLDSADPPALEAALRKYCGKAIVNSVSGKEKSLEKVLPLVKKYGASVIALPLDENGVPSDFEERIRIFEKIIKRAEEKGIKREDIICDGLTMTCAADVRGPLQTLKTIEEAKKRFGCLTTLGISNVSFGSPERRTLNRTFLAMALERGLDLPIIDTGDYMMMEYITARNALLGKDPDLKKYIGFLNSDHSSFRYFKDEAGINRREDRSDENPKGKDDSDALRYAIRHGLKGEASSVTERLIEKQEINSIIDDILIPALDEVGKDFDKGTVFLPQLISSATAAQEAFEIIKAKLAAQGRKGISKGTVVMATVRGDIHDIGKNIVKTVMENFGFDIVDLGKDVPAEVIVRTCEERNIRLAGLSTLMTTTLESMDETIRELRKRCPETKVFVGGAVLTEKYALSVLNADYYAKDASESVEIAREVFGTK